MIFLTRYIQRQTLSHSSVSTRYNNSFSTLFIYVYFLHPVASIACSTLPASFATHEKREHPTTESIRHTHAKSPQWRRSPDTDAFCMGKLAPPFLYQHLLFFTAKVRRRAKSVFVFLAVGFILGLWGWETPPVSWGSGTTVLKYLFWSLGLYWLSQCLSSLHFDFSSSGSRPTYICETRPVCIYMSIYGGNTGRSG